MKINKGNIVTVIEAVEKTCYTCKFANYGIFEEPCNTCFIEKPSRKYWECNDTNDINIS